jgi:hypothetical protein
MSPHRVVTVVAVLVAGCAAALREQGPPPPRPGEPVAVWRRESEDRTAMVIYARNDTTLTLTATFRLFDCLNVEHACGELPPRTLEPGVVVDVIALKPANPYQDYSFNYSFTARPQ